MTYCSAGEMNFVYDVLCRTGSASFSVFPSNYRLLMVGTALPAGFLSALRVSCQKVEKATVRGGWSWSWHGNERGRGRGGRGGASTIEKACCLNRQWTDELLQKSKNRSSPRRSNVTTRRVTTLSFASKSTKLWSQRYHSNQLFPVLQPLSLQQRQVCLSARLLTDLQTLISD